VSVEVVKSSRVDESEVLGLRCLCTVGQGGVNQLVDRGSGVGADRQDDLHASAVSAIVRSVKVENMARCATGPGVTKVVDAVRSLAGMLTKR
jgi:hypothetical protein